RRVYAARIGALLANARARLLYCEEEVAALFRDDPALLAGAALLTPAEAGATGAPPPVVEVGSEAIATVQYSSGSTGIPKGVLLAHRALLNNIRAVRDGLALTAADVSVNWIPLYHDMGLIDAFLMPLVIGCPTVLIPTTDFMREPALWLWAITRYRGTISWAPNFAVPVAADPLSSVALGRCPPRCEVEIRDAAGRPLPDRRVGAVWLRSDSLFQGYHRDPELTARILVEGWLDTGDQGYLADGDLYFVARAKDVIIIGGEKYAPHDVETAINRVPGVREGCAVAFGVLDAERGTEDLAAVVETRETDAARLAALREAIRWEVITAVGLAVRHLLLVPPGGIEKTTSGKLARRATRERHAAHFPH